MKWQVECGNCCRRWQKLTTQLKLKIYIESRNNYGKPMVIMVATYRCFSSDMMENEEWTPLLYSIIYRSLSTHKTSVLVSTFAFLSIFAQILFICILVALGFFSGIKMIFSKYIKVEKLIIRCLEKKMSGKTSRKFICICVIPLYFYFSYMKGAVLIFVIQR